MSEREAMLDYAIRAISDDAKERFAHFKAIIRHLRTDIRHLKGARIEWMHAAKKACDGRDRFRTILEQIAKQKTSDELGPDYQGEFKYGYDRLITIAREAVHQ